MTTDNAKQIEFWNGETGRNWVTHDSLMEAMLQPLGESVMDTLAPQPGHGCTGEGESGAEGVARGEGRARSGREASGGATRVRALGQRAQSPGFFKSTPAPTPPRGPALGPSDQPNAPAATPPPPPPPPRPPLVASAAAPP